MGGGGILKHMIDEITIEIIMGSIVKQDDITAIVNTANADLKRGSGLSGIIHRAAGPGLEDECIPLAPIFPGEAVITGGHKLPNEYVIHCLSKVTGSGKSDMVTLATCYYNVLKLADVLRIKSIAFPVIAAGGSGYSIHEAAQIALTAVKNRLSILNNIVLIRFVLYTAEDYKAYKNAFINLIGEE